MRNVSREGQINCSLTNSLLQRRRGTAHAVDEEVAIRAYFTSSNCKRKPSPWGEGGGVADG